ncbi:MAG: hypothetical protein J6W09_01070 [Bacteroidales bacterium]|nr:hypothetical protein [Bacteroidales bacterium]
MNKFLLIAVLLALSGGLYAQNCRSADGDNDAQRLYIAPQYYGPNEMDYFYMMPLEERLSAIYGSSYRKASSKLWAGRGLCILVAPIFATMSLGVFFDDDVMTAMGVVGLLGTAGSLGAGIPLWVSGRREMDVIIDDYSRRYAPRPYSLSVGPTLNGVGFAFNF